MVLASNGLGGGDDAVAESVNDGIVAEALVDAERVITFLKALKQKSESGQLPPVGKNQLLFLAAAFRLYEWERAGVPVHFKYGFPSARDLLEQAALDPDGETSLNGYSLSLAVTRMFIEHFCWQSRARLNAPVLLSSFDEEAVLDALAEFLLLRVQ